MNYSKKPVLIVGTNLETSAANPSSGFTQGEIGFFKVSDNTNASSSLSTIGNTLFYVAEKKYSDATKPSLKSDVIDPKRITKLERKTSASPLPQIRYAGYNGSNTATLSYNCDSDYSMRVVLDSSPYINKFYGKIGLIKTIDIHTECCTGCNTGCGTSDPIVETYKFITTANSMMILNNFIGAELVYDGSFLASDNDMTVTYGSDQIVFATAATYNTGTAYAVGDLIRIGGTGATSPIYKITAVNSLTLTLNTPYQGASGTVVAANSGHIATDGTHVGIKWTGKFLSITDGCCCFPPFPFDFEGVTFLIASDDLGCSFTVSNPPAQDLTYGNGSSRELVYLEMDALGYSEVREWFQDCAMNAGANQYTTSITSGILYTLYYIHYSSAYPTTEMGGDYDRTDKIVIIATPTSGGAVTALNTAFTNLSTGTSITFEAN
jgi:hypothetical protein